MFGTLMQQATQLKAAQLRDKRPEYESAPDYLRVSVSHKGKVVAARGADPEEALSSSMEWKQAGNAAFADDRLMDATVEYSNALSVWQWFEADSNEGMKMVKRWCSVPPGSAAEVSRVVTSLFLNLAMCSLKLHRWEDTIFMANLALSHDPKNVKALYRRSMARIGKDTTADLEFAVEDLKKAGELAPDDPQIRSALAMHSKVYRRQLKSDKQTYGGMFTRGDLYDEQPASHAKSQVAARMADKARELGLDVSDPKVLKVLERLEKELETVDGTEKTEMSGWRRLLIRVSDRSRWINMVSVGYLVIFMLTMMQVWRVLALPLATTDISEL
eukprot:TRINITY_DN59824_c0_g2_i1.p1 TRINITY_DN59824_c0_g2~~TRINITY_DN59824_c0_g2_i1.p1  ORF type:complete len:330 (-),score=57.53 TRINITY_DN59824_c0_g2_i1:277-1266(-)